MLVYERQRLYCVKKVDSRFVFQVVNLFLFLQSLFFIFDRNICCCPFILFFVAIIFFFSCYDEIFEALHIFI